MTTSRITWPRGCEGNCRQGRQRCNCWKSRKPVTLASRRWFAADPLADRVLARVLAVGFVVALLSALAGCGGGDEPQPDDRKADIPPACLLKPELCA